MTHIHLAKIAFKNKKNFVYPCVFNSLLVLLPQHSISSHRDISDFFSFFFVGGRILLCTSDVEFLSQLILFQGLSWWDVILM